tara:strand:- start:1776 stop:2381 length:606 start_codon:yes stop_codon:yes gene_type:complete
MTENNPGTPYYPGSKYTMKEHLISPPTLPITVPPAQRPRSRWCAVCCSGKVLCSLFCTALIFWSVINSQHNVSLTWEESELTGWRTTENKFRIANHNWLKNWKLRDHTIDQQFWYCKDILAVEPDCEWITSQSLEIPKAKLYKTVKGGGEMNLVINNSKIWLKTAPYWDDMMEACKYDLLLTFWTVGGVTTPTYRLCTPNE